MAHNPGKRALNPGKSHPRRSKKQKASRNAKFQGTSEEVLNHDILQLLRRHGRGEGAEEEAAAEAEAEAEAEVESLAAPFSEVRVTIEEVASTGDGLGFASGSARLYVVPFTLPGDVVRAKVVRHSADPAYTFADFVGVVAGAPSRDDSLVRCRYFGACSGCQLQMLPYAEQLAHKRRTVEKAFAHFSGLSVDAVPPVGDTVGSPLQYAYRTKLTPHFDGPPGARQAGRRGERAYFKETPPIGFMQKGTRWTLDIEECPIGTESVQRGLRKERRRVAAELDRYKRGATILLRESTSRRIEAPANGAQDIAPAEDKAPADDETTVVEHHATHTDVKTCITENNATTTEYVGPFIFQNPANAFFQNNNSIIPKVIDYLRQHLSAEGTSPAGTSPEGNSTEATSSPPKLENLIDAYCGSGLFSITLSSLFPTTIGIDISPESIASARRNAQLNDLSASDSTRRSVSFHAATASTIFSNPGAAALDPHRTAVIIDPPRKGCDEDFLRQLRAFGPRVVAYVSCNVHTQARDVGFLLSAAAAALDGGDAEPPARYAIESLRGFDFFPQTSHVESVCVLRRSDLSS